MTRATPHTRFPAGLAAIAVGWLFLSLTLVGCSSASMTGLRESVVAVRASGCNFTDASGSGVAVGNELIATSAHTVAGASEISVVDETGVERTARVVGFDPEQDVAILRIDGGAWQPLRFGSVANGEPILLATWRPASGVVVQLGTVARLLDVSIEDIYVEKTVHRDVVEVKSVGIELGDSGGAVVTESGLLAGIIYAAPRGDKTVGYAVTPGAISELLTAGTESIVANGHCP